MKKQTKISTLAVSSLICAFIATYCWLAVLVKTDNIIWVTLIVVILLIYYKAAMLIIRRKGYK
jgi:hypothetical protein